VRATEAHMRTGPGTQYPIMWTYQRPGLPLEVVKEYDHWRRVRDWQGSEGWMHSGMLSGKRSFIVTGKVATLRAKPNSDSAAVARIETLVIGRLLSCSRGNRWCHVQIADTEGWMQRADLWGVYENEDFE
jgi:SH3-like domain-containing protein